MTDVIARLGLGNIGTVDNACDLAMACRIVEGSHALITVGAHALATFLLDTDADHDLARGMLVKLVGTDTLRRLLADALSPDGETAEQIGRCTDGVVLPEMFEHTWIGAADAEAHMIAATMAQPLCAVRGVLGQTIAGPLFEAAVDPASPHRFTVSGLGLSLAFDVPLARSMRAALSAGLAQIEARG